MNKLFTVMGGKFKFQVQDSDLEYLFWQCEKHIALSEKKPPLMLKWVISAEVTASVLVIDLTK